MDYYNEVQTLPWNFVEKYIIFNNLCIGYWLIHNYQKGYELQKICKIEKLEES